MENKGGIFNSQLRSQKAAGHISDVPLFKNEFRCKAFYSRPHLEREATSTWPLVLNLKKFFLLS